MITERMADLSAAIDRDPSLAEVRLVSLSVDPDFDRPEVLRDYRDSVGEEQFKRSFGRFLSPENRLIAEVAIGPRRRSSSSSASWPTPSVSAGACGAPGRPPSARA